MLILALALLARPADPLAGRKLVFEQNFEKMKDIDERIWLFNDGPVYNHEVEIYTKKPAHNAFIKNHELVLEARKVGDVVTSGRLETKQGWKYGYFEAKAKVPEGRGTWPAVWFLGQRGRQAPEAGGLAYPLSGEMDLMEHVGHEPKNFYFTLHSEKYNSTKGNAPSAVAVSDHPNDYHVYGLDWKPDSISFLFDGKVQKVFKCQDDTINGWPYRDPFYLILNLAIGGDWGGQKGVDSKIFPSQFLVKYVRIYQ